MMRLESITILIDVDLANPIDGLLYGRHFILRSRFQGPRWINPETWNSKLVGVLYDVPAGKSPLLEPFKLCFVAVP